jgi:antirestriction protein
MHEHEPDARSGHEDPALRRDGVAEEASGFPPVRRPRIYVAWDSHHPSGIGQGAWIDAAQEPDQLRADLELFVAATEPPVPTRWSIRDAEDFGAVPFETFSSVERISFMACEVLEHDADFAACMAYLKLTEPEHAGPCYDAFLGSWASAESFASTVASTLGLPQLLDVTVPEALRDYVVVDSGRLLRDLHRDGLFTVVPRSDGGVWVFEGRP